MTPLGGGGGGGGVQDDNFIMLMKSYFLIVLIKTFNLIPNIWLYSQADSFWTHLRMGWQLGVDEMQFIWCSRSLQDLQIDTKHGFLSTLTSREALLGQGQDELILGSRSRWPHIKKNNIMSYFLKVLSRPFIWYEIWLYSQTDPFGPDLRVGWRLGVNQINWSHIIFQISSRPPIW